MSAETDTSTTVHIDMNAEIPCDTLICDQVAVWGIRFHQCGHTAVYCQTERDWLEQPTDDGEPLTVTHTPCTVSNTEWTWRRL